MIKDIFVIKRDGTKAPYDHKKIEKVLKWAMDGVTDVDFDKVIETAQISIYDGISSKNVHSALIDTVLNFITVETPNYQFVAGRLLNYALRKEVWGSKNPPRLIDLININIDRGFYDADILSKYSTKEINKINEFIDHDRDFLFTHGGLKQMMDKYLVQNRTNKEVVETPNFCYALVAMTLFANETKDRLKWVKRAYDAFSTFKINLATPVIAGCRTPLRSYSSCALFNVGDSLNSIGTHDYLFKKASASRYGLGFNISSIRPINSKIRHGDVLHTGLIPYLKNFESGIKACHQNGLRGASGTVFINFWHPQIEDVVVLKDNALPDERAVRFLDYAVVVSSLFLERAKQNLDITLFNPHEVPKLVKTFGLPEFDELYVKYENDPKILEKKKISARSLLALIAKHRLETGRIYVLFADNANNHGTFKEVVQQSNLCMEVIQPTEPSEKWNDPCGKIGVCTLAAVNPYNIKDDSEFESICEVTVRMLDNLLDYQDYFDLAAENFSKNYRSLGIGMLNFAAYLAKNKTQYTDTAAPQLAADLAEKLSFYCTKASVELAMERGTCESFVKTKWADGLLPIDHYNKNIDEFVGPAKCDWDSLRPLLKKYGIRNSTTTSYMPIESSSVVSGSTSGLEPIRDYVVSKVSRAGKTIVIAPDIKKYKQYYTLAFDIKDNESLIKIYAAVNKFTDMAISLNTYVNAAHYENNQIPLSVIVKTIYACHKYGIKTMYYNNTEDQSHTEIKQSDDCASGACKL